MLKACKLLAVAAMTAMVLAGCAKTTDVDASLETGTANYDFAGKTLVSVDTRSYTKQIETSVFDSATGITATNTTETAIPYWADTVTLTFAADKTYTCAHVLSYLPGVDGDYRTTQSVATAGSVTTTTTTRYLDTSRVAMDKWTVGLGGTVFTSDVYTGSWSSFFKQNSATDGSTLNYAALYTTNTFLDYKITSRPETVPPVTGSAVTLKTVYAPDGYDTTVTARDPSDYLTFNYEYQGTTAVNGAEKDQINIACYSDSSARAMRWRADDFEGVFTVQ